MYIPYAYILTEYYIDLHIHIHTAIPSPPVKSQLNQPYMHITYTQHGAANSAWDATRMRT